jgi:hypothetical protein
MKILFVGGDFDDDGGKDSGYFQKFFLSCLNRTDELSTFMNGGLFSSLENLCRTDTIKDYDVIYWFANVPNDKPKLIRNIKKINPKCILITSKANFNATYSTQDLISKALENKANLTVVFRNDGAMIKGGVLDPLGNLYTSNDSGDIDELTECLINRINALRSFTRVGSEKVGETILMEQDTGCFLDTINECADRFHELIHGANTTRMLGNASFRCEGGFPSVRGKKNIFVSRRNIDKRDIGVAGFVACKPTMNSGMVQYYGDKKPSVDTPIQLALYGYYKDVNYMIHSHVYIDGAPFTTEKISCGALEEFGSIIDVIPPNASDFAVNLLGHGSLICVNDPENFKLYTDKYIARPLPERN